MQETSVIGGPALQTAASSRSTATVPTLPRPSTPVPAAPRPAAPAAHRRARVWTQVALLVALLAVALVVGAYIVPPGGLRSGGATATTVAAATTPPTATPMDTAAYATDRPADALEGWAARVAAVVDIPVPALQAYGYAQVFMANVDPRCQLNWTTLAGIGQVESSHGRAGGAVLLPDGRSNPAIVGPLLDGKAGRRLVKDTDAGAYDGDSRFDRAMGPLRLMPTLWRGNAIDANGDGIVDPYNIFDSTLALARSLCAGEEDLRVRADWNKAIGRYHSGVSYARAIFETADDYGQRTQSIR
ncbi:murein transglycosylase [Luedemannella flava]